MKNKLFSVIAILAIVVVIIGIWIVKNNSREENIQQESQILEYNPDFALTITDEINLEKLKSYNLPIILDFGSEGCIPCREMYPDLKQVNEELQGKAIVKFIDVWKYPELAEGYPIQLIPTQVFISSNGTPYNPQYSGRTYLQTIKDENGNHIFTIHVGKLTASQMKSILEGMGLNG